MLFHLLFCLASVSASVFTEKNHNPESGSAIHQNENRIFGGNEPSGEELDNDFRSQVQLYRNNLFVCSGTIISSDYVLTAAQCVVKKSSDVYIRYNTLRLNSGGSLNSIVKIVIHPKYDPKSFDYDVAYMRVEDPFNFEALGFSPARLGGSDDELPEDVIVSGWGSTGGRQRFNDDLLAVEISVISNMRCNADFFFLPITKNSFCAEDLRYQEKGGCPGDTGGPAIEADHFYNRTLVGIFVGSNGCGSDTGPSIFTNLLVKEIRDFIVGGTGIGSQNGSDQGPDKCECARAQLNTNALT